MVQAGAVGINFEDQIIGSDTLYTMDEQSRRIRAAHAASEQEGVNLFINARTDLFLKERDSQKHVNLVENAVDRASAYREAGAKGFFVPGLTNPELIARICEQVVLPVNVMMKGRLLPEIRTASRGSLKSCLIGYILQSWSGFVPDACRGGQPVLRRHRPPVVKPERAGGRGRIQFRRGAKAEN